jgi:ABC-2 type transport system ATP-binding protein
MVRVDSLRKSYGATVALDGVSFEVGAGEVLAVLGPNGAGKTTLIEILEGLRRADDGVANVLGMDAREIAGARDIRARIGVSMQRTVLPPRLTVEEMARLYAALYPNGRSPEQLIDQVHLQEKRRAQIRELSGGQLQRLTVALAMVGDPDILFLDEPTSQLDPQARRAVWDLLDEHRARTRGVIVLTTHQMEEAAHLASRVLIMDHGRILAAGSPSMLVDRYRPGRVIEFTTTSDAALDRLGEAVETERIGDRMLRVKVRTERLELVMEHLMAARAAGKLAVEDVRIERHTLEDVFLHLTGRRIRD